MKYPKLFMGDCITIGENSYLVSYGLNPEKRSLFKDKQYNRFVYNIHLRSVKYNPNKFPADIYCKNTEMPIFKKVK